MESNLFETGIEPVRKRIVKTAREEILGKNLVEILDPENTFSLISLVANPTPNWVNTPSLFNDPDEYETAENFVVTDIYGLLQGAELITKSAAQISELQEKELQALEKSVALLEADLSISIKLLESSIIGPQTWVPAWEDNRDYSTVLNEPGLDTELNPPQAQYDNKTGYLTLPLLSSLNLYSSTKAGRIRILNTLGGDLVTPVTEQLGNFSPIDVKLHCKSNQLLSSSEVPWISNSSGGVAIRLRIDLDNPSTFSRVTLSAGSRYSVTPNFLYWYPFGNEGDENLLTDGLFSYTYASSPSGWTITGGAECILASGSTGPDAGVRLADIGGDSAKLLILSPGLAERTTGSTVFTTPINVQTSFVPSAGEGAYRLAIRWRGLGDFIDGSNAIITLHSRKANGIAYTERYNFKEGLTLSSTPAAGEFSFSRFLIHVPENTEEVFVSLSLERPNKSSDQLQTSMVEVAMVNIDRYAGRRSDWREPVEGQNTSLSSHVINIPLLPEAAFFEISMSQVAYEKVPDSDGIFGREYDLSIYDITIDHIEYSRNGRWLSVIKEFLGEPRRFQLLLDDSDIDDLNLGNADFRIILRPGEPSYPLDTNLPLQIIAEGEDEEGLSGNLVSFTPREEVIILEGTDLSGKVQLPFYPYVNKETILELAKALASGSRRINYDPNAIAPLRF